MIPDMITITSPADSRIQPYTSMTNATQLYERIVVVEGAKVVKRILQSSLRLVSFFATARYYEQFASELHDKQQRNELAAEHCYIADKTLMSEIVGYELHEGVMALAKEPIIRNFYDEIRTIALPAVCLSGVVDAENVGAIVRNCAAFGVQSLIIDGTTSSPYLRRAVRVSLGGIFGMRVFHSYHLADELYDLKQIRRARVVAADLSPSALSLASYTFPQNFVLLFGSEGSGLSHESLSAADDLVQIPIYPSSESPFAVHSLDVAAASAIMLYQARMQGR
jgi:tRNA G18 (ribose-2'-O)-methylase SpoU